MLNSKIRIIQICESIMERALKNYRKRFLQRCSSSGSRLIRQFVEKMLKRAKFDLEVCPSLITSIDLTFDLPYFFLKVLEQVLAVT